MNFEETTLPVSFVNSLADIKCQKFDGIKNTENSVRSNFYVISYVNINTEQGNFFEWGPNRFVEIWFETGCC